jgi:predicted acyl esterase
MSDGNQHTLPRAMSNYVPVNPRYKLVWDRDVMVPMRDGVRLCADCYRPEAAGKFPTLLAIAGHNKQLQTPELAAAVPPQPAWSAMWQGGSEGGDGQGGRYRGRQRTRGDSRPAVDKAAWPPGGYRLVRSLSCV